METTTGTPGRALRRGRVAARRACSRQVERAIRRIHPPNARGSRSCPSFRQACRKVACTTSSAIRGSEVPARAMQCTGPVQWVTSSEKACGSPPRARRTRESGDEGDLKAPVPGATICLHEPRGGVSISVTEKGNFSLEIDFEPMPPSDQRGMCHRHQRPGHGGSRNRRSPDSARTREGMNLGTRRSGVTPKPPVPLKAVASSIAGKGSSTSGSTNAPFVVPKRPAPAPAPELSS